MTQVSNDLFSQNKTYGDPSDAVDLGRPYNSLF